MNGLHLFGTAPIETLIGLGLAPSSLEGKTQTLPFSTLLFETRTSSGAYALAEVFGFNPDVVETWTPDIANIDENSKEFLIDLPEVLATSGEEHHLKTFHTLRKIPGVTAVVDW